MPIASLETPVALTSLVEVQGGSVVSQMLAKSSGGTVTVFAFDAGEGLSEHAAPFDALVLGVAGRATLTVDGVSHELSSGDVLRLPANVPHAVHAVTAFKMLLIMIKDISSK